ncbi:hypothetical protein H4R20_005237 [Coemansia guatemalensis]|uniref:Bacterial surface antigen (D15) domain-containing protein n=1 Tax=Coemansia guatemalensis TaxID=2761395 RepID=A0A9W8LRB4_9FUNG|nr:hypothetical protein H4R20_005237 [Coemansia guatemalensis]
MATDNASFARPSALEILNEARQSHRQHSEAIDISKQKTQVKRFSITGVSRIRSGFLRTLLAPMFEAQTVEQAVAEGREAAGKLQALGIARRVEIEFDSAADAQSGMDVRFRCEDGSRYALRTGVDVGDNEGTANVTGRLVNIWGGGESLEAHYARGSKTQAAFQGILLAPIGADPQTMAELSAHQITMDNRPYSAHDEVRRTLSSAFRAAGGTHEVRLLASWREICGLGASASPSLRAAAGHTLKTSILHTIVHDDRDSQTVPTSGSLLRMTSELAGLLGDVRFAKTQAELQTNQRLGTSEYIVSTNVQGGLLWSPGGSSPLADRFFLGGQTSVRGFEHRGIGPRDHNDSLGGDIYYAAGLSLLTPLPYIRSTALKGHLWANAGQLALLDSRGLLRPECTPTAELKRFLTRPSVAVGLGLVYRHSMVRVELSCCIPLVAATTDRPKPGLQFGLGVQFL